MSTVSVRDLRNHGGDVLTRVESGECVIVTRDGVQVAELRPLPRRPVSAAQLIARRQALPPMDLESLRVDLDAIIDPAL